MEAQFQGGVLDFRPLYFIAFIEWFAESVVALILVIIFVMFALVVPGSHLFMVVFSFHACGWSLILNSSSS